MTTLNVRGHDAFIYVCHLLGELSTPGVEPRGGNVLELPDDTWDGLPEETRGEIARFLRVPEIGPTPPGEAEGGAVAPEVGRRPSAPLSLQPLPWPPETGPGSGRSVWARYAVANGVPVPNDMGRDEIIATVKAERPDLAPAPAEPDPVDDPDAPPTPPPADADHPDAPPIVNEPAEGTDQEAQTGGQ